MTLTIKTQARWILLLLALLCITIAPAQQRLIKGGDKVRLTCEEEPSLNRDYTITRDGLIVLSFVGAIPVGGLDEQEAASKIAAKLVEERIVPQATVHLSIVGASQQTVRYSGAVKVSGEAAWHDGMHLSDVIDLATPTSAADLSAIVIKTSKGKTITVNFVAEGADEQNPALRAGDEVFIPAKIVPDEVFVLGAVKKPGAVTLKPGLTVQNAIDAAGGLDTSADSSQVQLQRGAAKPARLDLRRDGNIVLRGGDRIVVQPLANEGYVMVGGEVMQPGPLAFHPGMTLTQAISAVGGESSRADISKVKVIRLADGKTSTQVYNLWKIKQGMKGDVRLVAGDRIEVAPSSKPRISIGTVITAAIIGILIFRR